MAVVLAAGFVVVALVWNGVSWDVQARMWGDIADRFGGPMSFRFILQPTMATIAALHDGIADARSGRAPYLHTILTKPAERGGRLREAAISIGRIILLGFVMDAIYQWRVLGTFYPGEAVLITLILAVIPYFILRGPIERIAHWWIARQLQSGR
ncbi:MAG: hypothetical protein ABWY35_11425 [Pseudorhodoplanes sp.]